MKRSLLSDLATSLHRKIGIDLGAESVRMWVSGGQARREPILFAEASCLAVDSRTQRVLAVGNEAAVMTGRVAQQIEVRYPFQDGAVYDVESAVALLRVLLQQKAPSALVLNTTIMASVPASATLAERELVTKVLYNLGAQEAFTIAQPLAAAIGAGVPIADASGSFLLQMGHSSIEGVVISLGSLVAAEPSAKAGRYILGKIQQSLKKQHGLRVGLQTARRLLVTVARAFPDTKTSQLITGQDFQTGSPKEVEVTAADLALPVEQVLTECTQLLQKLLSRVQPELTVDVIDKGILLAGGLAQLEGIESYLTQKMGIPAAVVEDPETAVIRGIGTALTHLDLFKQSLGYQVE